MSNTSQAEHSGTASVANPTKEQLIEKVKMNIARAQEAKKNMNQPFLTIKSGESKVLQFTGDIEPIQKTFKRKKDDGTEEEVQKHYFRTK